MKRVIIFDGICNLCNGTVKFIRRHDKKSKFHFLILQTEEGRNAVQNTDVPPGSDTIIYIRNSRFLMHSSAVLYILKDLGKGWQAFFCLIIIPAFIRDFIYKALARNRYRIFGRSALCPLQEENK